MTDDTHYQLVVSFEGLFLAATEERAFVLGYEVGRTVLEVETTDTTPIERTVHTANQEVFRRWSAAKGYTVDFAPTDPPYDEWCVATFTALPRGTRLRVVTS